VTGVYFRGAILHRADPATKWSSRLQFVRTSLKKYLKLSGHKPPQSFKTEAAEIIQRQSLSQRTFKFQASKAGWYRLKKSLLLPPSRSQWGGKGGLSYLCPDRPAVQNGLDTLIISLTSKYDAGWSSPGDRQTHNLKVLGSNQARYQVKSGLLIFSGLLLSH
jgi:hypothetical protein